MAIIFNSTRFFPADIVSFLLVLICKYLVYNHPFRCVFVSVIFNYLQPQNSEIKKNILILKLNLKISLESRE